MTPAARGSPRWSRSSGKNGLGANVIGAGRAYLNLGTGVVSGAFSPDYLTDRAFRTLYAPVPGGWTGIHRREHFYRAILASCGSVNYVR